MDYTARLIEFLTKGKTWFVPSVVVRPEAVMDSFARAIEDPAQALGEESPNLTQSLYDSLLLETAVQTNELAPSDHYNLVVVALDHHMRDPHGGFDPAEAKFLLFTMLRYLPQLATFDPGFRHRGAAALSLLLYRDRSHERLDPEDHFTVAYLLVHHCRAAMNDVSRVSRERRLIIRDEGGLSEETLRENWGHWFEHDPARPFNHAAFDAMIADMMIWRERLT